MIFSPVPLRSLWSFRQLWIIGPSLSVALGSVLLLTLGIPASGQNPGVPSNPATEPIGGTPPSQFQPRSGTGSVGNLSRNSPEAGGSFSSSQSRSSSRSVFERSQNTRNRNNNSGQAGGNSSRSSSGNQQSATGLQRNEGQQRMRTVRGAAPAASGARSGGGQPPVVIEFSMKANPNTNLLYLEGLNGDFPSMNIVAEQGTTFPVRAVLGNNRGSSFEELDLSLKFEPSLLRVEAVDDEALLPRLASEPQVTVDKRRGLIRYRAQFSETANDTLLELFRLEFTALQSAPHARIQFLNTEKDPTLVANSDGISILQLRDELGEVISSSRTGLLDASVTISPNNESRERLREGFGTMEAIALANAISEGTARGGFRLALNSRVPSVRAGEEFLVDVSYANPEGAEVDSMKLRIIFDPRVLQVLDKDEGNWITKGINIWDGPYQEELPFDFHRRNIAYNGRGEIQYEAGFNSRVRIPAAGTIATIRFRALQPIDSTAVAFSIDEDRPERETSISFLGFNLIGTPGRRSVSVTDTVLRIRP